MSIEDCEAFRCTTPLGEAVCRWTSDGGDECWWGCIQKETCEIFWWPGHLIRYAVHISEGFARQTPIVISPALHESLRPHLARYACAKFEVSAQAPVDRGAGARQPPAPRSSRSRRAR